MKSWPTWFWYSLARVLLVVVPFAVLMIAGVDVWISAIVAALFGLAASLVFLRKQRDSLSTSIHDARTRNRAAVASADDDAEDAAADAAAQQ
ncbi:MAG TPA: DUF4229 domain-containing protein [Candidatus Lumbricidophila sp.]|nr:DUF4229 domain-containing protein [Candidatus Lumbricidophila sp.]